MKSSCVEQKLMSNFSGVKVAGLGVVLVVEEDFVASLALVALLSILESYNQKE